MTRRPSRIFELDADASVVQHGEYRARASVSGPLGDATAARVSGFYNDVRGHIRNVANDTDLNGGVSYGARAQLELDSGPARLLATLDHRRSEQDCCQWQAVRAETPLYVELLDPVVASHDNRAVSVNAEVYNHSEQWGVSIQAETASVLGRVVSITAHREWRFSANNDVDSVPTATPRFGLPNGFGSFDVNRSESDIRQFSQELRLESAGGGTANYVLGGYYYRLDVERSLTRRIGLCLPSSANDGLAPGEACNEPLLQSRRGVGAARNENLAAFGQVDWALSDRLILLTGARVQYDRIAYDGRRRAEPAPEFPHDGILGATFLGGPAASVGSGSASDSDLSGRLGLQYRLSPHAQAYATYTRGYKGMGFDIEPTTDFASQSPVRPETVDAFEVGLKGAARGGTLSYGFGVFRQEYTDMQVQASTESGGLRAFVPANAGESLAEGIEVEVVAQLTANLSMAGGFTVLDTDLNADGLNCLPGAVPQVLPVGQTAPGNVCFRLENEPESARRQNVRGGRLPNAPRYATSTTVRLEDRIADTGMRAFAQTTLSLQGHVIYSLEQDRELSQGGYTTIDASVGIGTSDNRHTLTLFVRNLFDRNHASVLLRSPTWPSTATTHNVNGFLAKDSRRYVGVSLHSRF